MRSVVAGIIGALVSLWGGAYVMHEGPGWVSFPAYVTSVAGFILGLAIAGTGVSLWLDGRIKELNK